MINKAIPNEIENIHMLFSFFLKEGFFLRLYTILISFLIFFIYSFLNSSDSEGRWIAGIASLSIILSGMYAPLYLLSIYRKYKDVSLVFDGKNLVIENVITREIEKIPLDQVSVVYDYFSSKIILIDTIKKKEIAVIFGYKRISLNTFFMELEKLNDNNPKIKLRQINDWRNLVKSFKE